MADSTYIIGSDVLGAAPFVWPSVNEYPIEAAQDMLDEVALAEVESIIGQDHGLWPRGNVVWPGVELEEALRQLPPDWEYAIGAAQPQIVRMWEGTTQDLYSHLDPERRFDESFDEAMMRRTGMMRGGR